MPDKKTQTHFLVILLIGAFILSYFVFSPFLVPLILAVVFAVVFDPFFKKILGKMPEKKSLASFLTTASIIFFILVPITFIGSQLLSESRQLYSTISDNNTVSSLFNQKSGALYELQRRFPNVLNFSSDFSHYSKQIVAWITQNIGVIFSSFTSIIMGFFIFAISLYYIFKDGKTFKEMLVKLSPLTDLDDEFILNKLKSAINSVVRGNLTIALIQGFLTAFGFIIFGIPNFVIWGTIASICALIPSFGTSLVVVPGIIYLFVIGSFWPAIGLLLWGMLAVGLIDNFLAPKLIGKNMSMHPMIVLFSVLGGMVFFGPIGFILGPLTLSFLMALLDIYREATKKTS